MSITADPEKKTVGRSFAELLLSVRPFEQYGRHSVDPATAFLFTNKPVISH
jgi:hypothetical protein